MKININYFKKFLLGNVVKNSIWLLLDKFIRLFGGLLVGAWIARYLGPEDYGLMNFAISFSTIFISFSMLGIDNLVVRELSKNTINLNNLLGTAVKIRNVGSILSAIIAIISAYLFYGDNVLFVYMVTIFMVTNIFQSMDVITLFYQSKIKSEVVVKNKLLVYIIISIIKIIFIKINATVISFILLTSIELILGMILVLRWFILNEKNSIKKWKFSFNIAKKLLSEGWMLAISNLSIIIFMKSDQIFLGGLVGNKEVGIYSIAVLVSNILYSVPMIITSSILPKLTQFYKDRIKYRKYSEKIFMLMVIYSYIVIGLIYIFIDKFIMFLYGSEYVLSGDIIKIHSLTLLVVSIGCIRGCMYIVEGKTKILSIITITGGALNIILNYILINKYGIYGAAYAALISQSFVNYFSGFFYKSLYEILILQTKSIILFDFWKKILIFKR